MFAPVPETLPINYGVSLNKNQLMFVQLCYERFMEAPWRHFSYFCKKSDFRSSSRFFCVTWILPEFQMLLLRA